MYSFFFERTDFSWERTDFFSAGTDKKTKKKMLLQLKINQRKFFYQRQNFEEKKHCV